MQFINNLPLSEWKKLPVCVALYLVKTVQGEDIYIGSTTCLRKRFKSHMQKSKFPANSVVYWNVYENSFDNNLGDDELDLIAKLNPPLNRSKFHGMPKTRSVAQGERYMIEDIPRNNSVLHQVTFDLLWARIKSSVSKTLVMENIRESTGLGPSWIEKFAHDKGGSPSVDRIETLYKYLTGEQIKIDLK